MARRRGTSPNIPRTGMPTIADLAEALKEKGWQPPALFFKGITPGACMMHLPPRSPCGKPTAAICLIAIQQGEAQTLQPSALCAECAEELERELQARSDQEPVEEISEEAFAEMFGGGDGEAET